MEERAQHGLEAVNLFGWLSGLKSYAYLAIGIVVLVLSGSVYVLWLWHQSDLKDLQLAKQAYQQISSALAQSEADKALLARKSEELDRAIQERDSRLKALNETKRKLADELDGLKKTLPQPDQSCLDRALPGGVLDLLRDGPDRHQDDSSAGAGKPADPVPEV